MSIRLEIIVENDADLIRHMSSLGFFRGGGITTRIVVAEPTNEIIPPLKTTMVDPVIAEKLGLRIEPVEEAAPTNLAGPARIPGQPSEGRKRRTRAEVVEDEAYFAAHPERQAAETRAAISTGEERVDPEAAAQDAVDEAAESAAHRTGDLTTEDLRGVIGFYSQRHGIAAAQADIPKLLGGKGIHEIDKTQEALKTAIDAVRAALDGKRTMEPPGGDLSSSDKPAEEVHATKDDVMEAIKYYARKFDGPNIELAAAKNVLADIPALLDKALGVKMLKQIPADPVSYGKALRAINEAVNSNPFKRDVVK